MSHARHLVYLLRILGRRALLAFGTVALVVVFLLAAIHVAARHALKHYAEDQLARVPWDMSLYQTSDLPLAEAVRRRIAAVPEVTETQDLFFLRAAVPTSTVAYIDGEPLRSPWLSLLTATDRTLLPPEIRPQDNRAVLVLVGSKAQMGDAFLRLQQKRRFDLKLERDHRRAQVFGVPLERIVRIERNELNRWFMEQTSSPTLVPELGVILVAPYDWKMVTAFDAVARGIKHAHEEEARDGRPRDIHSEMAEYFPDVIHLARVARRLLVSGWDVEATSARLHATAQAARQGAQEISFRIGLDNTSGILFKRMGRIARLIGLISLLAALPLLWMAWVLLANLAALLLLNERRKLGLLRLRGVPGEWLRWSLTAAIGLGGALGGLAGAGLGTWLPVWYYAPGELSWTLMWQAQDPWMLGVSLIIGMGLSLAVSLRLTRLAAGVSPLEASGRLSVTESAQAGVRFGWLHASMLLLGAAKVAGWAAGWSLAQWGTAGGSPPWLQNVDRALDFLAYPFFVYGATTLIASRRRALAAVLRPGAALWGGRLAEFSLRHGATRPHRAASVLLIVALMASLSLYPTVMTAVFDDKTARGAQAQLGSALQLTLNAPDLAPGSDLTRGALSETYPRVRTRLQALRSRLRQLPEVGAADYLIEGLSDGLYMPGYGFNSVPIYLLDAPPSYLANFYHEPSLGVQAPFARLIGALGQGGVLASGAVAEYWSRPPGARVAVGRDVQGTMLGAVLAGAVRFMPGIPLATVNDRESFVSARIDYLNYLFHNRAYLVAAADDPRLAALDVLIPRAVIIVAPRSGVTPEALRTAVLRALPAAPLQVRELQDEIRRLGSDMYIFLARANLQIYWLGGILLALIGILAVALANYADDRRTLGLLRIRGCGPRHIRQFMSAGLSAPAFIGLVFGGLTALLVGYGMTDLIWQLRELKTIMHYLSTHLAVSERTVQVCSLLLLILLTMPLLFSRWVFRRSAREGASDR